jgi:Leucine-rich repeat (LRR) protein
MARKKTPDLDRRLALDEAERRIAAVIQDKARGLDLSGLGLHRLPERLRELTWLERLELQDNRLTELPNWR